MAGKANAFAARRIVVGVTGGIAAYKTAMVVSRLVQRGAEVRVVMTESATRFVAPLTFETLSGSTVHHSMWERSESFNSAHVALADWAEVCVIAPATANIIAKMAHGLADDLLSTTVLALEVAVLLAPAMNDRMWHKAAVQENLTRLSRWGYHFVGPAEGRLACGTVGPGRMAEPEEIVAALESLLTARAKGSQAGRQKRTKKTKKTKKTSRGKRS